ncbi:hypothetical protein [Treponema sp.]|uniref:hypothetical protein n=1 Tax=Treponema sp. TaxID=166 RepID=UPI00298D8E1A|nr:hypothetical protein [Treponema sp.]MCR5613851.1 hypothetical protein [Treponema sp.]
MTADEKYLIEMIEQETGEKYIYENQIFSFSYVQKLFALDKRDKDFAVRMLNSAQKDIELFLGYELEDKEISDDIREAIIAMFMQKFSLCKSVSDYAYGDEIDNIMERKFIDGKINEVEFEQKFTSIPAGIFSKLYPYTMTFKSIIA